MLPKLLFSFVVLTLIYLTFTDAQSDITDVYISLSNYDEKNHAAQVFNTTVDFSPGETKKISVTDINRLVPYFIIQVHSFHISTSLSTRVDLTDDTTVTGTNNGLVQRTISMSDYIFYVKNNDVTRNNTVLILVVAYTENVPIPGGCNMEFMVEIAPYQKLNYTTDLVTVDAQPASLDGYDCEDYAVGYKMYHMYLPVGDFGRDTYFSAIQNMVTPKDIMKNGIQIHKNIPNQQLRRFYSAYKGTGAVYALVATFEGKYASYVPITTYACAISNSFICIDTRFTLGDDLGYYFYYMVPVSLLGLFLCWHGHTWFKSELFIFGLLVGSFIAQIGFTTLGTLSEFEIIAASASVGAIVGLVWLIFWCYHKNNTLASVLIYMTFGFYLACVLFYAGIDDISIMESDINYWGFLVFITTVTVMLIIGFADKANIMACITIGAYLLTLAICNGPHLCYIFVNVIRRATVENFNYAVISPSFQNTDLLMIIGWLLWVIVAIIRHVWKSRNNLQRDSEEQPSETSPLLQAHQYVREQPIREPESA